MVIPPAITFLFTPTVVGPGIVINIQFTPDPIVGDKLFSSVVDSDNLTVAWGQALITNTASVHSVQLGWFEPGTVFSDGRFSRVNQGAVDNQSVTLQMQWVDSTSHGKAPVLTQSAHFSGTTGIPALLEHVRESATISPEVQDQLDTIQASVQTEFPSIVPGLIARVSDLVLHPGAPFLTRDLIGDFSGNHRFTRPGGPFGVNAFGITWEVLSYGGGIGLDTGVPVRFETRLLDIAVAHLDNDGHEFVSQAEEFVFSNFYLMFASAFPNAVDVAIAPSVTIRFYWLLATL